MPHNDVHRVLSRAANDPDFRDQIARDPEATLAGYDLTDAQRRRFAEGGAAAMELLSWWSRGEAPPTPKATAADTPPSPLPAAAQQLDPVLFTLQVQPAPQPGPDGQTWLAHAAALHAGDVTGLPGACFRLRLAPLATPQPGGSLHVHYTATIDPQVVAQASHAVDTSVPTNPWGHDTTSPAVEQAAAAARQAAPEQRHRAIMDLIAAVTGQQA